MSVWAREKSKKERQKKINKKNYVNVVSIEFVLRVIYIGKNVIRYYRIFFFLLTKIYTLRNVFTLCVRDNRNSRTKRNDYEEKKDEKNTKKEKGQKNKN